jgi:hypothetical protein
MTSAKYPGKRFAAVRKRTFEGIAGADSRIAGAGSLIGIRSFLFAPLAVEFQAET